jgi:hypothetical protein
MYYYLSHPTTTSDYQHRTHLLLPQHTATQQHPFDYLTFAHNHTFDGWRTDDYWIIYYLSFITL